MTDKKKPAETEPTGADAGNRAPDEARRKLAKAALAAPVIMTLGPRSVFGQACSTESIAVQIANSLAGGAILSAAANYDDTCVACLQDELHSGSTATEAVAECTSASSTTVDEPPTDPMPEREKDKIYNPLNPKKG